MRSCWCGNSEFLPFSTEYEKCVVCGTLVSQQSLTDEQLVVVDDETDFYGQRYWLGHQADDLGFPDIYARARNDLTERNLHWLRTLLKYSPPPARILELGSGHGSFVGLMAQAGYDASGLEVSAWVVEFGKKTFGVPIALGPIEDQSIAEGSLDAIVSFDVLEHLPDPVATMDHCLGLLKPNGVLLIQTPRFRDEMSYAQLVADDSPFLGMLQPDEHLFLFTESSVKRLFARIGAEHILFEPAIFADYDMFFAVGRCEAKVGPHAQSETALSATPGGRIVQGLLDLKERESALTDIYRIADADRTRRGASVESLSAMLAASEADRAARGEQVVELTRLIEAAEADRLSRSQQVDALATLLQESEADRAARGIQIETLTAALKEAEADRAARGEQIVTLTELLNVAEADRAARGVQIETLTQMLHRDAADRPVANNRTRP